MFIEKNYISIFTFTCPLNVILAIAVSMKHKSIARNCVMCLIYITSSSHHSLQDGYFYLHGRH